MIIDGLGDHRVGLMRSPHYDCGGGSGDDERYGGDARNSPHASHATRSLGRFAHDASLNRAPECFGCAALGEAVSEGSGKFAVGGVFTAARVAFGKVSIHARASLSAQRFALPIEQLVSCFCAVHDP
jgi:hypothetical protein